MHNIYTVANLLPPRRILEGSQIHNPEPRSLSILSRLNADVTGVDNTERRSSGCDHERLGMRDSGEEEEEGGGG